MALKSGSLMPAIYMCPFFSMSVFIILRRRESQAKAHQAILPFGLPSHVDVIQDQSNPFMKRLLDMKRQIRHPLWSKQAPLKPMAFIACLQDTAIGVCVTASN